ncbi:MAG TPA: hypothetical protein DIT64_06385 [Verrucomicrobiales bacterium]|nr:hypothetical protein [Verrucomicrobiales bacterium]
MTIYKPGRPFSTLAHRSATPIPRADQHRHPRGGGPPGPALVQTGPVPVKTSPAPVETGSGPRA